jgi:hypothetical protein
MIMDSTNGFNLKLKCIAIAGIIILCLASACTTQASQSLPTPATVPTSTSYPISTPISDYPIITWNREGGIAGFCDEVVIFASGKAHISSCKLNNSTDLTLSASQISQIINWKSNLKKFVYDHKDDAVADAMSISLVFAGAGQNDATDNDKQAILSLVSEIALQANH